MVRSSAAVCVLLAGVLGVASAGADKAKPYGSPQEVFAAWVDAARTKDWQTFAECLTADALDRMTAQGVVGMAFMKPFIQAFADKDDTGKAKEAVAQIDALLTKHGLTREVLAKLDLRPWQDRKGDPAALRKAAAGIAGLVRKKGAFLGDAAALMQKLGKGADKGGLFDAFGGDVQLEDVKIAGDTARGIAVANKNREKSQPLAFKKEGGGWKIELPSVAMAEKNEVGGTARRLNKGRSRAPARRDSRGS
jgi:hypothetical protein